MYNQKAQSPYHRLDYTGGDIEFDNTTPLDLRIITVETIRFIDSFLKEDCQMEHVSNFWIEQLLLVDT